MSSLSAIRAATQSRTLEEKSASDRQRDALVLILSHLQNSGFVETATTLLRESMSLKHYEMADNLDLMQILKEYEEFYEMRLGRRPIFCRPTQSMNSGVPGNADETDRKHNTRNNRRSRSNHAEQHQQTKQQSRTRNTLPPLNSSAQMPSRKRSCLEEGKEEEGADGNAGVDQGVTGFSINSPTKGKKNPAASSTSQNEGAFKPLPHFDGDFELRSLAMSIRRDIIQTSPGIAWNDIIDLKEVKRLLKEAIILPRRYPELFTGLRSPWRSVLLHGPPGTGKTLLAKAVATESKTTFFNISASSIVSKYRGDSEKLVRVLFELARHYAPSTIFFDEIDSIIGHRGGIQGSLSGNEGSEHEGSRRMKTEILLQMDGLIANNTEVFVLAASNLPWDLDAAFLRRMEKRILIPLPSKQSRKEMIQSHLSEFPLSPAFHKEELVDVFAEQTDGFSGSDIKVLCKEVSMRPLRRMLTQLEHIPGALDQNLPLLIKKNPITEQDFVESLSSMNQSTDVALCKRHKKWSEAHGSC